MAVRRAAFNALLNNRTGEADPAAVESIRHGYERETNKILKRWAGWHLKRLGIIPNVPPVNKPRPPKRPDPDDPPDEREFPPPPDP